jgi:sulfur-carrier protein
MIEPSQIEPSQIEPSQIEASMTQPALPQHVIRIELPTHLRRLAQIATELRLEVERPVTQRSVLDALEAKYPVLRGTIRDQTTLERRPLLRFFACEEDWTHEAADAPLPEAITLGLEPFLVIGAIAGG